MTQTLEQTIQGFIDNSHDVTAANTLTAAFDTAKQSGLFRALREIQTLDQRFSPCRTSTNGLGIDMVYLDPVPGALFSRVATMNVLTVEGDEITALSGLEQVKVTKGDDIKPIVDAVKTRQRQMLFVSPYGSGR